MTHPTLERVTNEFVSRLNRVIGATLDTSVEFLAEFKEDGKRAGIEPSQAFAGSKAFPLLRQGEESASPVLLLRAQYTVEMAPDGRYLQVVTSTIGLWVDVTGGRKKHRPLIRLEYDRKPRSPDRAAAHVHLHANSPEMAWLYGSSGQPAPDLHALHFPVGGRRFRPTLEEFLLFLDRERLYTNMKPNWKRKVLRSLEEWREHQAAATAKRHPSTTAAALRQLGYTISPPRASEHPTPHDLSDS